ncbi:MAG: transglutaminase-like domain-containing protein [Planctomycetota bacterium]|jgi:transglutaminase-like putative cysteine protease
MKTRNRRLLFALGVCMIGLGLYSVLGAQELRKPTRTLAFEVHYRVKVQAGTSRVMLTALVPQDLHNRQQVESLTFTPKPKKVFTKGGEKYAHWDINAKADFTIKMRAKMLLRRNDLQMARARARKTPRSRPLPPKNLKDYLAPEKFIECKHQSIRKTAMEIVAKARAEANDRHAKTSGGGSATGGGTGGGKADDIATIKALHAWVLATMKQSGYNPKEVGAAGALAARIGDCTEYSDLFVALCRARGVPARVVEGYTSPWSNVPQHNWAEVWLDGHGWISFDPFRAEWHGTAVDRLKNIYIHLSHTRNDKTLHGYHFYWYAYDGVPIEVSSQFKVVDPD